ncbi:DUF1214 domain-containing protein [Flavobacteriaceae bacterium F89]|uniref:DUF1214 domain-containing protein n=1 Tax=Cerina litoralis TaxID=2874477 RepID=A0AAE3JPY0_9FLAO|nr:DUF1214 domain-containing protein [Cerina litoralis]MCG2461264.1 DUF1214 domain-containing protein [Cerina litoralis]
MKINFRILMVAVTTSVIASCNQPQPKESSENSKAVALSEATLKGDELIRTDFGDIQMDQTYITQESIDKLNKQLHLQRAVAVYEWALPVVSFQKWYNSYSEVYGANDLDFVESRSFEEKVGILTANATTPYVISWANLANTGPVVIEYPAGPSAGGIMDFFQTSLGDLGLAGQDKGKGGKYLIIPNGYDVSKLDTKGYFTINATTNKIMIGTRFLSTDEAEVKKMKESFMIGKYGETLKSAKFIANTNKRFSGVMPSGYAYFELVHQFIQDEPMAQQDKIFYTYMKYFGIEDGQPLKPSAELKNTLTEGAKLGELMSRANQIAPRHDEPYYDNTTWYRLMANFPLTKSSETDYYLDESNQYYFEAVTVTAGMKSNTPGPGTTSYLTNKKDKDGNFLKGSNTYKINIPADMPASNFWAFTIYSEVTRCFIDNENAPDKLRAINLDSRDKDLQINADGSVDLYIGHTAPEGKESNWVQTNIGEGWFPVFRTYGTQQAFFDKTWQLGDIELVK